MGSEGLLGRGEDRQKLDPGVLEPLSAGSEHAAVNLGLGRLEVERREAESEPETDEDPEPLRPGGTPKNRLSLVHSHNDAEDSFQGSFDRR